MHTDKIKTGKLFGFHHRFKVCTGARYLGSYIRYDRTKHNSLKKRTEVWDHNIFTIRKTVGKYPQESYAEVVRTIRSECIFLQRVTQNTEDAFLGVRTAR